MKTLASISEWITLMWPQFSCRWGYWERVQAIYISIWWINKLANWIMHRSWPLLISWRRGWLEGAYNRWPKNSKSLGLQGSSGKWEPCALGERCCTGVRHTQSQSHSATRWPWSRYWVLSTQNMVAMIKWDFRCSLIEKKKINSLCYFFFFLFFLQYLIQHTEIPRLRV